MPTRKRYKKRRYKRKRYVAKIPKAVGGFPIKKLVKLRYAQEIVLPGTSNGIVQHQFRANSVYDPDFTGVGHQPMNYDRWAALYDHYTVMSSKCKVTPTAVGTSNVIPGYVGIMISTDSGGTSTLSNVTSLFENKLISHKWLNPGNITGFALNPNSKGITSYFNAKRIFGVVNPEDGAAYGALISTNPARDAYFNVYIASVSGNTPANITALVEMEYTVLFDEMVTQTQN